MTNQISTESECSAVLTVNVLGEGDVDVSFALVTRDELVAALAGMDMYAGIRKAEGHGGIECLEYYAPIEWVGSGQLAVVNGKVVAAVLHDGEGEDFEGVVGEPVVVNIDTDDVASKVRLVLDRRVILSEDYVYWSASEKHSEHAIETEVLDRKQVEALLRAMGGGE